MIANNQIKRGTLIFHRDMSYIEFVCESNEKYYEIFYVDFRNNVFQGIGFGGYSQELIFEEKYYYNGELK